MPTLIQTWTYVGWRNRRKHTNKGHRLIARLQKNLELLELIYKWSTDEDGFSISKSHSRQIWKFFKSKNIREEVNKRKKNQGESCAPLEGFFPSIASFLAWQLRQSSGPSQGRTFDDFDEPACTEMPSPGFSSTWQTAHKSSLNMLHTGYTMFNLQSTKETFRINCNF